MKLPPLAPQSPRIAVRMLARDRLEFTDEYHVRTKRATVCLRLYRNSGHQYMAILWTYGPGYPSPQPGPWATGITRGHGFNKQNACTYDVLMLALERETDKRRVSEGYDPTQQLARAFQIKPDRIHHAHA